MSVIDMSIVPLIGQTKAAPKVSGVHPTGSLLLVELLTPQELTSGNIVVAEDAEIDGPPQAYVLEIGPKLPEDSGIEVGQRVIVQGRGVPVPKYDDSKRVRMLVEYSMIKAVLVEQSIERDHRCCCVG